MPMQQQRPSTGKNKSSFIYIYIYVCVCIYIYYINIYNIYIYKRYILQCVFIHYSYYLYDACPNLDSGNLFKLALEVFWRDFDKSLHYLEWQDVSWLIIPQNWNKPLFQEALIYFNGKLYFKTIIWVLRMLTATGLAIVF